MVQTETGEYKTKDGEGMNEVRRKKTERAALLEKANQDCLTISSASSARAFRENLCKDYVCVSIT